MQDTIDPAEDRQHEQRHTAKRNLKLTYLLKSLRNWRGQLLLYFALLAIMFAGVGFWQHKFVHRQVYQKIDRELTLWATMVSAEIAYKDKWELKGFRNAAITVPSWYIVTKDGLIIDSEGEIISGMFGRVEVTNSSIYGSPKTVVSSIGETWRLLGRKVDGGTVVVGIPSSRNIIDADKKLLANIAKFGSTLIEASSIRSREIDEVVDYAVLSSTGELIAAWGGVPLKTIGHELPIIAGKKTTTIKNGSNSYRLY